jgi:hypothetical protein
MQIDPSAITAEVYFCDSEKERFFVKVGFEGTGMWINSFSVTTSKYEDVEWWVQAPAHRQNGGFVPTVDFAKGFPLWKIIQDKAIEAVEKCKSNGYSLSKKDTVVEEIPDGPITLDDIPF